jgi:hypothetical protein
MPYALQDKTVKRVVAIATEANNGKGPIPNYVPSLDLNAMLAEERTKAEQRIDTVVALDAMRFEAAGPTEIAMVSGDYEAFAKPRLLTATAEYHIATKTGVPAPFFRKCSSSLKLAILAEHGDNLRGKRTRTVDGEKVEVEKEALVRIDYDGRVRALLSPGYGITDNADILASTIQLMAQDKGASAAYLTMGDTFMHGRILFPSAEQTLGKGDRLVPGVQLRNSEVGLSSVSWAVALFRVSCWNGIIMPAGGDEINAAMAMNLRHTGKASAAIFARLDKAMAEIIANAPALAGRVTKATSFPVADGEEYIRNAAGRYGIPKNVIPEILVAATESKASTAWDYINAITATAQGRALDQRVAIERAAGKMLAGLKN